MSARVSLSRRTAQAVLAQLEGKVSQQLWPESREVKELRVALAPRPRRVAARKATKQKKASKAKAHREETSGIYHEVAQRAAGRCEHCGFPFGPGFAPQLDHFWMRRNGQSVEECWLLSSICHARKEKERLSGPFWLQLFRDHAHRHGYSAQVAKCDEALRLMEAKASLAAGVGHG
jgi:hypothetical protein